EDGIRDPLVTGVQTCALPILPDGALDPAFGGGVVLANMRSSMWLGEAARAVALQGDDRIVATGSAGYATGPLSQASYCATARFRSEERRVGRGGIARWLS